MRLVLKVVPNARRTEVVGLHGDGVKIKIQSPATDGRANAALLEFLAESLNLSARSVRIISGEKSRDKIVEVDAFEGETAGDIVRRMKGGV